RLLAETIATFDATGTPLRQQVAALLKSALAAGRQEIERRLLAHPSRGLEASNAQAYLVDQLLRVLFDVATQRLHPLHNPTAGER
ncbi:hypothetical protein LXJ56_27510, partial [Escherichia coli]|nr:hypothetical protein [Escherichia coli]